MLLKLLRQLRPGGRRGAGADLLHRVSPDTFRGAEQLAAAGRDAEALAAYSTALELAPGQAAALCAAAALAARLGAHREAVAFYERALPLMPGQAAALLCNMGASWRTVVQLPQAEDCFRRAVDADPQLAEAQYNLGSLLFDMGRIDEAEPLLARAVALRPDFHVAHSTLLCLYGLHRNHDPQRLLDEHRGWSERHASGFTPLCRRGNVDASPGRRLTIGYVSGDFREHSVSFFIEPVLASHDRNAFRIIGYDNWTGDDAVNRRLQQYTDAWRRIGHLDDDAAAAQILADKVDILVDLSGHTVGNRLLVFARRPAPIQASWFGYMCTTGLAAMDYRLTDAYLDPPGATERYYSEQLLRITSAAGFAPAPDAPPVGPLPFDHNGRVTFGSFNNYAKVTDEAVSAWGRILTALPSSRLLLVALGGDDAAIRRGVEERFAQYGVPPGQLLLRGRRPLAGFFAMLGEVDIALDPFPYSGGTTSLHTLWMGVPIVALEGDSELSKSTAGMLRGAGAHALVAGTVDQYCDIVLALAREPEQMRDWRARLRGMVQASPAFATGEVTRSLEQAFRVMWHTWVDKFARGPERAA